MVVLVPTMHKEAPTLTDPSRTKSDGSASLVVFSSDKFSIRQTIKSLSIFCKNIFADIFQKREIPLVKVVQDSKVMFIFVDGSSPTPSRFDLMVASTEVLNAEMAISEIGWVFIRKELGSRP